MLTVYTIPASLYCAQLRILLRHKNLKWREVAPPGGYGSDEYKQVIASGNLPALVDGDIVLADSEAIAEYLNEKHPDPAMLPAALGDRAKVRERSRFHDTRLEPAVRKLFPHIAADNRDEDVAKQQSMEISGRLNQLGKYLAAPGIGKSDGLTLGDCGFPITFTWLDGLTPLLGLDIDWPPSIGAYRREIDTIPAVADELSSYRPIIEEYLSSP